MNARTNDNRVIVRIWPATATSSRPKSWLSTGHVALETFIGGASNQGYYISFWPGSEAASCPCADCGKTVDHFHTREEDVAFCGQAHIDNTFTLHTLVAAAISVEFERRLNDGLRWTLSSSLLHHQNLGNANCTSLVYDLLIHGGFNSLVSADERVMLGVRESAQMGLLRGLAVGAIGISTFMSFLYRSLNTRWELLEDRIDAELLTLRSEQLRELKGSYEVEPREGTVSYALYNVAENYGVIGLIALAAIVAGAAAGVGYLAYRFALNYFTVKPSDIYAQMQRATDVEREQQQSITLVRQTANILASEMKNRNSFFSRLPASINIRIAASVADESTPVLENVAKQCFI